MIQVIGSVVVVLCVIGGFVLEGGKLLALWHPTEILIIVGAALGAFLTSNPLKIVKAAFSEAIALVKGPEYGRDDYVTLLKFLYQVFVKIRKEGLMAIDGDAAPLVARWSADPAFREAAVLLVGPWPPRRPRLAPAATSKSFAGSAPPMRRVAPHAHRSTTRGEETRRGWLGSCSRRTSRRSATWWPSS